MANTVEQLCMTAMSVSATRGGDAACFQIPLGNLVTYFRYLMLQHIKLFAHHCVSCIATIMGVEREDFYGGRNAA